MRFVEASRGSFDVLSMRVSVFNKGVTKNVYRQYNNDDAFKVNLFQTASLIGVLSSLETCVVPQATHLAFASTNGVVRAFSAVYYKDCLWACIFMGRIGRSGRNVSPLTSS
ncbi:unnamed protein product [Ectocarpus sp. 6 AP-2014]